MGYYVSSEGVITVPAENLDAAYQALVDLNKRDDLKRGGSSRAEKKPASSSVANNPNVWFSWMPWNYDAFYSTAQGILEELGFDTEITEDGSLTFFGYDNKTGAEDVFVEALAPYVSEDSEMIWTGEDAEKWRWTFKNGEMIVQEAVITWE